MIRRTSRIIRKQLLLPIILFLSLQNCAQTKQKGFDAMIYTTLSHTVPTITTDSLNNIKENVVLLDARSKEEYEISHIKKARWVGFGSFNEIRIRELPADTTIVVYCSVGYRSEKIGEKLYSLGYKNVYNLYGGIFNWINQSHPVYKNDTLPTNDVHPYSDEWGIWLTKGNKVYK